MPVKSVLSSGEKLMMKNFLGRLSIKNSWRVLFLGLS